MGFDFMVTSLTIISLITNVTVEALKKILNESNVKYSSNILVVITSTVVSIIACIIYIVLNNIDFTSVVGIKCFILIYLSFVTSTIGYDKVIQMIQQIQNRKENRDNE